MRERLTLNDRPEAASSKSTTGMKRLMDSVVVLDLTFHRPSIHRKANIQLVETEADKKMLGLTKALVTSKEYSNVCRVATDVRAWIERRALPSPLKRGTYLISLELVPDVYEYLDKAEADYKAAAEEFLDAYPERVEEAREKLADQFDPENYPTVKELRPAFWLERRMLDFGVPSPNKIGKAFWSKEKKRAEQTWAKATDEIQEALRSAFRSLVGHLAERLEPKADGTKKTFRDSAITKLLEFIDLFKNRNLTGDIELEGLVIQARDVLKGKGGAALRKSAPLRGEVAGEMSRVLGALDELLENAPRRKISFDD